MAAPIQLTFVCWGLPFNPGEASVNNHHYFSSWDLKINWTFTESTWFTGTRTQCMTVCMNTWYLEEDYHLTWGTVVWSREFFAWKLGVLLNQCAPQLVSSHLWLSAAKGWTTAVVYGNIWLVWSNCSDLTRPHPKWWFRKGNPLILGKSRLVKYYFIWLD